RSPAADWRRLPARTTVVEYLALPSRLVIFAASADGLTAEVVACDREALAAEATDFAKVLESGEIMKAKSAASALYRRLIEPVASHLIGATTIAFVPDTVTSVVPFGALIDRNGDYLLVQYTVLNAPSAAVLQAASARRAGAPPPRSVLVIAAGEQLHYASAEGERVAREYQKSVVLKNEHARFDALTNDVANADVIHFAGHAIGDDSGFVPASIALERRVEAAEIARLPLRRTSVVVLAGCSTARGAHRGMEGVISVAHGFLAGGAPSVIATLWPIDDTAAATFFPRIHQRLAEGLPPAEAVREAQLESIRRGDVPASLWAAIQDIGS
ncbi:MAG TPA: CHAT domain-containing protein, partial [Thermoanaerobaculia bacterium]|nr:CHAT domain-containing protein [Thermoanaerobaculia bacterium]